MGEGLFEVREVYVVVADKSVHALSDHAQTLLYDFLERFADRHDFAHRLHRRADFAVYAHEFSEVPAGDFHNHIVYLRGHICRVGSAHLADLVECVSQGELSCHECQGVS